MVETQRQCKHCNKAGAGSYCSSCGQKFITERLSLKLILREAFHFFTHVDHGFPYTIKRLFSSPGKMQREYIDGYRLKHQKPFSMFFLCASIAALAMYWINLLLIQHFNAGDSQEAVFFHKYWVLLQVFMLPFYALIIYLFFKKAGLNYGEIIVLQLYVFSFLFIALAIIHLLKFIFPHLQTRYIELPVIILYTAITNIKFFIELEPWRVVILTILSITLCFLLASFVQDRLVKSFL